MSRKKKKSRQAIGNIAQSVNISKTRRVEEALMLLEIQMARADYAEAIETGQKLLNDIPQGVAEYVEVLGDIGLAHARLQHYPQAYEAFAKVLSLEPDNLYALLDLGIVERYTDRLGQSVRDLERVVALLDKTDPRAASAEEALKQSIKDARAAMKKRGPNFTLDQLIEQEALYRQAKELMAAQKWEEAEQTWRRSVALGDCHPQPWGNIGFCLIKQHLYDEAEVALKRAVAIDKHYPPAQINLQALERLRRGEHVATGRVVESFEGNKVKKTMVVDEEESKK